MRLSRISIWFSIATLLVLGLNASMIVLIRQAHQQVLTAQQHRQQAQALTFELQQEAEQLATLVRAYTITGKPRYLTYYFDILAIRNGEKAAPPNFDPATYWNEVIAGRIEHRLPANGVKRSIEERMTSLGFSEQEFAGLSKVVAATAAMKEVEKVAFAAAQGFAFDEKSQRFIDGEPRLDLASNMVHSDRYNILKADLSQAAAQLANVTERRTRAEVAQAIERLNNFIKGSLGCISATFLLVLLASRAISRQVLQPIRTLSAAASELAAGQYATRVGDRDHAVLAPGSRRFGVLELTTLGLTFNSMAQAIEQELLARAQVQRELEAARQQSDDATLAKSMFLANMSHEIRTPMNAIIGMAYLALQTELSTRQRDYVDKVHKAARSLLGIINNILDFSKVEAGKVELDHSPFVLEDVIANALTLLQQVAHEKDVELIFDATEARLVGARGALIGDPLRLAQILTNLLSNSIKFTDRGYVKLNVCVEQEDSAGVKLKFTLRDTGIGMDEQQLGRLFREFTQADGSTTRRYGGTGLGLAISKKFVELMDGQIWVDSTPGQGSCFTFTARFAPAPAALQPSAPLPERLETLRVLAVDDQDEARSALRDALQALGVGRRAPGQIACAGGGAEALAMIEAAVAAGTPYDVLLLDWVMPEVDGGALLTALARRGCPAPLPVVVSAYDASLIHAAAEQLGVRNFLPKPVLPNALRYTLEAALGTVHAARPALPAARTQDLRGMRVLLVEDNPINQQLVQELMEMRGVEVELANNGLEALERLEQSSYHAVLMDVQMPVMDGYEATRRIRAQSRFDHLPVIAMTAHALPEERARCTAAGMNGHVSKPIEPEQLQAVLASHFRSATAGGAAQAVPAAPAALPVVAEPPLPRIAGLDVQGGLRRAGGKHALYLQLLERFMADFNDAPATLTDLLASDQWEAAERLAHTLNGLSGTLGATELQQHAAACESACRARAPEPARAALDALDTPLQALLLALRGFFAARTAPPPTPAPVALADDLPRLQQMLAECDSEALLLWQRLKTELTLRLSPSVVSRIGIALDNFEFDKALALLTSTDALPPQTHEMPRP